MEITMRKLLLTDELLDDAERHDDKRYAEIGDRQRHEKVVGDVAEFAFHSDSDTDQHVAGDTGRYQRQQQKYLPAPLISYVRHLCAN